MVQVKLLQSKKKGPFIFWLFLKELQSYRIVQPGCPFRTYGYVSSKTKIFKFMEIQS